MKKCLLEESETIRGLLSFACIEMLLDGLLT